jgi:hypothetical protein
MKSLILQNMLILFLFTLRSLYKIIYMFIGVRLSLLVTMLNFQTSWHMIANTLGNVVSSKSLISSQTANSSGSLSVPTTDLMEQASMPHTNFWMKLIHIHLSLPKVICPIRQVSIWKCNYVFIKVWLTTVQYQCVFYLF